MANKENFILTPSPLTQDNVDKGLSISGRSGYSRITKCSYQWIMNSWEIVANFFTLRVPLI